MIKSLRLVCQVGRIRRTAARRREFHILFMVITTVLCYLICWMPYGVVAMMATFGRPGLISPVASVIPSILAKTSTVINPVIYILMNKQVSAGPSCYQVAPGLKIQFVSTIGRSTDTLMGKKIILLINLKMHPKSKIFSYF